MQSTCVQEGSRVPNLQMEFNYLDLFKSYCIFSDFIDPVVPMSSPRCPCHPRHPHVIPIAPRRSPCGPHDLWSLWSPPHVVPVVPIIPIVPTWSPSSPSSPCHLEGPHIISNPPDAHFTYPPSLGVGDPKSVKNAIRFELIKIF